MKKIIGLFALVAALLMAACGGTETTTVVQTVTVSETPTTEAEPADAEPEAPPAESIADDDCDALGINRDEGRTGRCVTDGQRFAVVDKGTELRLKTVAVRFDGIDFQDTISSDISSETASGTFATITLTVRNRSNGPQSFSNGFAQQTILMVGRRQFTQDFDVENGADQQSFNWQGKELQSGASQTGNIVFDVPRKVANRIATEGQLVIADFGVDLSWDETAPELGVIRLWK